MHVEVVAARRFFSGRTALEEVTLDLASGEIGCLVGPSGCGKTTLLRCIAGLETLDSGEIRIDGAVLSGKGVHVPPEQRGVGFVFQEPSLFPHLTIAQNVRFGLEHLDRARQAARTEELLARVGLADRAACRPHELSGGEQQRVALCRALAPEPKLLLLDEPFASLDADLRSRLADEVRDLLSARRVTALWVTHDQREAMSVSDRLGIMRSGRLEQWNDPYTVYHRPVSRFAADFIGQGSWLPAVLIDAHTVQTELGAIALSSPRQDPAGTPLEVMLRPDDLVFDEASVLRARIRERMFLGAEFLYELEFPGGLRVQALGPSHEPRTPGDSAGLRFDLAHVAVFAPADR